MKNKNQFKVKQQVKVSPVLKNTAAGTGLALVICIMMLLFSNMSSKSTMAAEKMVHPVSVGK